MIEEAYVSYEVAKLLKEKGFDEKCQKVYLHDGTILWSSCFMEGETFVNYHDIELAANYDGWIVYTQGDYAFLCPTQQTAMRWLREEHKMHICVGVKVFDPHKGNISGYSAHVWYKPENNQGMCCDWIDYPDKSHCVETYEEAAEAALKYVLENLI